MPASSSATAAFPMMVLSFPRPQRRNAGETRSIVSAVTCAQRESQEMPDCVLLGADLGRLSGVTKVVEDSRGLSPRFARLGGQARRALRGAEGPQRDRLPLPVARGLVAGQRLPQALQRLRVPPERRVAAPEACAGHSRSRPRLRSRRRCAGPAAGSRWPRRPGPGPAARPQIDQRDALAVPVAHLAVQRPGPAAAARGPPPSGPAAW